MTPEQRKAFFGLIEEQRGLYGLAIGLARVGFPIPAKLERAARKRERRAARDLRNSVLQQFGRGALDRPPLSNPFDYGVGLVDAGKIMRRRYDSPGPMPGESRKKPRRARRLARRGAA